MKGENGEKMNAWENLETGKRAKKASSPSGLKRFELEGSDIEEDLRITFCVRYSLYFYF